VQGTDAGKGSAARGQAAGAAGAKDGGEAASGGRTRPKNLLDAPDGGAILQHQHRTLVQRAAAALSLRQDKRAKQGWGRGQHGAAELAAPARERSWPGAEGPEAGAWLCQDDAEDNCRVASKSLP
jgi:hypothetical protein